MSCSHCSNLAPGSIIKVHSLKRGVGVYRCLYCGGEVTSGGVIDGGRDRWDTYFYNLCKAVASKSPCLSRNIGAVIVRDRSVVSTGYNGPPRKHPHCRPIDGECPRHAKGYKSGEGLRECPATHAEANAIANAAKLGVSVDFADLYLNTQVPCKDCMSLIVNAGIKRVICEDLTPYHKESLLVAEIADIEISKFAIKKETRNA